MITATAVYGYMPGFVLRALKVRDHLIQPSQPHCGVRIEAVVEGHRRQEREASLVWPFWLGTTWLSGHLPLTADPSLCVAVDTGGGW